MSLVWARLAALKENLSPKLRQQEPAGSGLVSYTSTKFTNACRIRREAKEMNAPSVRESSGQQRGQHMLQWRGNQSLQTKTALSFTTLFLHCKQNLNIRPQRFSPTNLMLVFFMSQSAPSVRSTSPVSIQCPENERLRGMEILQNLGWFHTFTCYKCLEFGIYVV